MPLRTFIPACATGHRQPLQFTLTWNVAATQPHIHAYPGATTFHVIRSTVTPAQLIHYQSLLTCQARIHLASDRRMHGSESLDRYSLLWGI